MSDWWWIVAVILYFVIGALGRRKKAKRRQAAPKPAMEEVLRDMRSALGMDFRHLEESLPEPAYEAPPPLPVQIQARNMREPAPRLQEFMDRASWFEDDPLPARLPKRPRPAPAAPAAPAVWSDLADRLRDPKAAREAFVMSEILGRPHALRRRR